MRLRLYRALLVKEGGQGIPRYHFQNNQNLFHGTVTKQVIVSGLKGGFPDPGLSPVVLGLMYSRHDREPLEKDHGQEIRLKIWLNLGTSTVETRKYCKSELNRVYCL